MDDNFDSYFNKLDSVNEDIVAQCDDTCCGNNDNHLIENGMIMCKQCNMIINNIIDSPEWKNYKNTGGGNTTRCGMPVNQLLPQSSLGTNISCRGINEKMKRIDKYQKWNSMPYRERSLYKVYKEIELKCSSNDLPIIISDTAKMFYKSISETKISRGKNRIGIIAACIYYSCKECRYPRSDSELASHFNIDKKIMTKGCKNFTEIIRLSNINKSRIQSHQSVNLYDFIDRFCHKLKLSTDNIKHIKKISNICEKLSLTNDNTPPAMAGGSIYLFIKHTKLDISKKQISEICKISEVTINKCFKKIENIKEINDYLNLISE